MELELNLKDYVPVRKRKYLKKGNTHYYWYFQIGIYEIQVRSIIVREYGYEYISDKVGSPNYPFEVKIKKNGTFLKPYLERFNENMVYWILNVIENYKNCDVDIAEDLELIEQQAFKIRSLSGVFQ